MEDKINTLVEIIQQFRDEISQYPLPDFLRSIADDCMERLLFEHKKI